MMGRPPKSEDEKMVNVTFKVDPAVKAEVEKLGKLLGKRESEVSRRLFSIGLQEYKKRASGLLLEDFQPSADLTDFDLLDDSPTYSVPEVRVLKPVPKKKKI